VNSNPDFPRPEGADVSDPVEPWYLIAQGVHRAVAAREAGVRVIPLEQLVSPKPTISRWDRGRDFFRLIELMRSPAGRAGTPPIFVGPVSDEVASRHTPLSDVSVLDDPAEDNP
jgi:hypothetical protein